MKKIIVLCISVILAGCALGGSANLGGGSHGVGMNIGVGTGIRF